MRGKYLFILVVSVLSAALHAQENNFSQFYTSPQYINPAFAGDASHIKAGGASRLMEPLPNQYMANTLLHFDYKVRSQHNGLGFLFFNHTEKLSHSKLQVNYSHTIRLSQTTWAKGGLGLSINQRRSSASSLNYPDQYNNLGLTSNPTLEPGLNDNSVFPGVSAGLLLYNQILWLSLSGDYLNFPKEEFAGQKSTYPMKLAVLTGMLIPINKRTSKRRFSRFGGLAPYSSIGPIFSFITQDMYHEYSGGLAFHLKPVFGGLHYRYQHDYRISDSELAYDAIVFMCGYRQEEFSFTYSYDMSLSSYGVNRSGAHEISAIFYLSTWKSDEKRIDLVPLPNQLLY